MSTVSSPASPVTAAVREVTALLNATIPSGPHDSEHAAQVAQVIVHATMRNLGVTEQHNVTVSRGDRLEKMQAGSHEDALSIADRMLDVDGVDDTRTYARYGSPWRRTS